MNKIDRRLAVARISRGAVLDKTEKSMFFSLLDTAERALTARSAVFSPFIDPIKAATLADALEGTDVSTKAFGGTAGAERLMVCFAPDFLAMPDDYDFPIARVKVTAKKVAFSHRDVLGSILAIDGVRREHIGDILVGEGEAVVFVTAEAAGNVLALASVGRNKATAELVDFSDIAAGEGREATFSVETPRIDAVVAKCFNLSRTKAQDAVKSGVVFVNWIPARKADSNVKDGDVVTLRGSGRVVVREVEYSGKKVRIKILLM